jgi:hypothetical protein
MSCFVVPLVDPGVWPGVQPKYIKDLGVDYFCCRLDDVGVVNASTSGAQDSSVSANADAILIPPLDNTIGAGALAQVQSALEGLNVPAQWVQVGMSYRTVVRVVCGFAQLVQRTTGLNNANRIRLAGNLDKTMAQIPAAMRTTLQQAADDLNLDRSGITGATTLREALRIVGQQFAANRELYLGSRL